MLRGVMPPANRGMGTCVKAVTIQIYLERWENPESNDSDQASVACVDQLPCFLNDAQGAVIVLADSATGYIERREPVRRKEPVLRLFSSKVSCLQRAWKSDTEWKREMCLKH